MQATGRVEVNSPNQRARFFRALSDSPRGTMKRTIARALRQLANHLDPSRGWTVKVEHALGAAGRSAGDEFRQRMQAPGSPFL